MEWLCQTAIERAGFAPGGIIRKQIHCAILAALVAALLLSPVDHTAGQEPFNAPDPGARSRFGIVEAYYRPGDARDLGVGWDRIIFEWAQFQPDGPAEFRTDAVPEAWLTEAQDANREVVGLLKNTPLWASGTDLLGSPPTGLDLPVDNPDNYWAAFVERVVTHYGDEWGINHWIIYNEPDLRPGEIAWYEFDGDVTDYYRMLKVAYLAAKSVNPNAVIHIAGMAWWTDVAAYRQPFLRRLLDVISSDADARANGFFFDAATVHTYFGTSNVWKVITETRSILWYFGLRDKEIWVDETNARPSHDPLAVLPPDAQFEVSLDQQAAYIVQSAALSLAAGAGRFGVYRLYDNHYSPGLTEPWGLVRGDGSRRPAFDAYRTVIRLFGETIRARRYYSDRSSLVTLEQPGRTIYVMWARGAAPVTFHALAVNKSATATRVSVYGATSVVEAEYVSASEDWKWWYVLVAPGAVPGDGGAVVVEGSPVMLIIEDEPRSVWIEVQGAYWTLR